MLEEVFKNFEKEYQNIFSSFYPSLESTGFQERNLSVNFSKAYEKAYPNDNVFSWFELQFRNEKDEPVNHFDCLIVNITKKEIYFVEAKRFKSAKRQEDRCKKDIERIEKYINDPEGFLDDKRFVDFLSFKKYGLILADVWQESPGKTRIYERFLNKEIFKEDVSSKKNILHKVIRFNYEENGIRIKPLKESDTEYDLLTFLWEL